MSRSELHLREARVDSSAGPLYVCGSIGRSHTSAVEGSGDAPPDGHRPVLKRRKTVVRREQGTPDPPTRLLSELCPY